MDLRRIERQRDTIYHRTRAQRIQTLDAAARWLEDVGLAWLFASTQAIELPSLYEAVKGKRDAHIEDWDTDSDRVWAWKNDLPAEQRAYYGKALANGKPVFIARSLLPHLLTVNAPENFATAYAQGRISHAAKRIHDALRDLGPTPTLALRAAAGFDRDGAAYHRALDELQRALVILPCGAAMERGAWASQIFDLVAHWFPQEAARAQKLELNAARRILVKRYLATVIASTPPLIARMFSWRREQVNEIVDDLVARRIVSRHEEWIITDVE